MLFSGALPHTFKKKKIHKQLKKSPHNFINI